MAPLLALTNALQAQIWQLTIDMARRAPTPITASESGALNDMFDASHAWGDRDSARHHFSPLIAHVGWR
jgi:hypothetical protein